MAAAAVLRGGSRRILAYPALLAAVISSPTALPDVPAAAGTQPPPPSPLAAGLWARSMATFTRTKQFPVQGYREIVRKMATRAVSPLRPRRSPALPPLLLSLGKMAAAALANGDVRAGSGGAVPRPTNPMVTPLLTDLYQFSRAYAYWKAGKHLDRAIVFTGATNGRQAMDVMDLLLPAIFPDHIPELLLPPTHLNFACCPLLL